ncbi:MAG: LamG-like jellyroll fold domain-containing protein [Sphingobacterium sp.]
MKVYTYTTASFFVTLILQLFLSGCTKESTAPIDLQLSHQHVVIQPGDETEIQIQSGVMPYEAKASNPKLLDVRVEDDRLILSAKSFQGEAETMVYIEDANNSRASLLVQLSSFDTLQVDQQTLDFSQVLLSDTLTLLGGLPPFQIEVSEGAPLDVHQQENQLIITGLGRGKSTLQITDRRKSTVEIPVHVGGEPQALDFGDQYFAHADFSPIAVVDESIRHLEQVTFEMTCNIQAYRGLQTFLGLEGYLIVRGKHDAHHDTHPIEIAGLGDRIMLESKSSFPLDAWIHLALVVDGTQSNPTDKYKLYINGVEDELQVIRDEETHETIDLTQSSDGGRFEIGRAFGQDWRALRGQVSQAKVWTVARTAEQIAGNLCTVDPAAAEEGLLAFWDFSSGTATNYIPDSQKGPYRTDLILSDAKINGAYQAVDVPLARFEEFNCPW